MMSLILSQKIGQEPDEPSQVVLSQKHAQGKAKRSSSVTRGKFNPRLQKRAQGSVDVRDAGCYTAKDPEKSSGRFFEKSRHKT